MLMSIFLTFYLFVATYAMIPRGIYALKNEVDAMLVVSEVPDPLLRSLSGSLTPVYKDRPKVGEALVSSYNEINEDGVIVSKEKILIPVTHDLHSTSPKKVLYRDHNTRQIKKTR